MGKQFYAIQLEDYSLKNIFPVTKTYYGTLDQIGEVIDHLATDMAMSIKYSSTIYSFHSFLCGNTEAVHIVAGETMRLLTPVTLHFETTIILQNPEWQFNNGAHNYCLRADLVNMHQVLLQDGDMYLRCARPCYEGLQYRNPCEDWADLPDELNGFPYIYARDSNWHCLRLYVMEQVETEPDPCMIRMKDSGFICHHEACNDLFGGR